ncbi:hypothetical protein G9A89_021546 [Geosiphon pyriformis]|nr:hypothetical protein G9A89_021546 [Geosiphon pyriformis]
MTQSPIFAVSSVVEDTLEKNCELWLILQNMKKAYDSVGWEHLKKINRVMTDFGLTNSYQVHDGLDQGEQFILAGGSSVSGNSRSSFVWHSDSHMTADFTSIRTAGLHTYFMKALHHRLPVTIHKCLYNRSYPSVVCLYCEYVEVLDHENIFGLYCPSSYVLRTLSSCVINTSVHVALCKSFVFNNWFFEVVSVFGDLKLAGVKIVDFVCDFCLAFRNKVWLVRVKHRAFMEKHGLIPRDGSMPAAISGLFSLYLAGIVRLLGIDDALGVKFGLCKFNLFISGALNAVSIHINA